MWRRISIVAFIRLLTPRNINRQDIKGGGLYFEKSIVDHYAIFSFLLKLHIC